MSVMLTGDVHGDMSIARIEPWNVQIKGINPNSVDYLVVLGDWGAIWNDGIPSRRIEKELLELYDSMPWETLVVLGNHEGYDRIERLPMVSRHGGPVRQVTNKVFILQHGNIYLVDGRQFFVFGGGLSIDKNRRMKGESWWPQEIPSEEDFQRGLQGLAKARKDPDFVLTHTCPTEVFEQIRAAGKLEFGDLKKVDPTMAMLDRFRESLQMPPRGWYFGHFHVDFDWQIYHCLNDRLVIV